jgi:cell division control protein 45
LFLFNIGSLLDLSSRDWFGDFNPDITIHVIDSNRPQNLESLFSTRPEAQRIVVWDDGNVDKLRRQREAFEILSVCATSVITFPIPKSFCQRDRHADIHSTSSPEPDEDDSRSDITSLQNEVNSEKRRRAEKNDARVTIDKHYNSGRWYGQSASGTIYVLATILKRADNDLLW